MFSKSAIAVAAVAGLVSAAPQAVTSAIAPKESPPSGCSPNYPGTFQIQVVNVTQSSKTKRDDSQPLISTLKNGVLTDSKGRTGYIASNNQFQYDGPPQAGAIYTAGFSVCNGSLALGDSAVFYQCLSGTFYNLYDENEAAQCSPVHIQVLGQEAASATTAAAQQIADGQVTASPVSNVACQIGDGQLQDNTCTGNVVTQINDGQIQAATGHPVTQIGDGQIQVAPTAATPTATANPVTQINDGQIQAPAGTGAILAPANGTVASPTVVPYTGSASSVSSSIFGLVAGLVAVLAL